MGEKEYQPYLGSLLYQVLYRPSVDVASAEFARRLKAAYRQEEFPILIATLEWALENPAYRFESVFPTLGMSDEEIRQTFARMLVAMKSI